MGINSGAGYGKIFTAVIDDFFPGKRISAGDNDYGNLVVLF
jgi:hypothetical protein